MGLLTTYATARLELFSVLTKYCLVVSLFAHFLQRGNGFVKHHSCSRRFSYHGQLLFFLFAEKQVLCFTLSHGIRASCRLEHNSEKPIAMCGFGAGADLQQVAADLLSGAFGARSCVRRSVHCTLSTIESAVADSAVTEPFLASERFPHGENLR